MSGIYSNVESERASSTYSSTGMPDEFPPLAELNEAFPDEMTDECLNAMEEAWLEELAQPTLAQQVNAELAKFYATDAKLSSLLEKDRKRLAVA